MLMSLLRDETGGTAFDCVIVIALISFACFAAYTQFGEQFADTCIQLKNLGIVKFYAHGGR